MPLHVPVPAVALEGDYSSYALKWRCDAGGENDSHAIRPRNDGGCYFWDYIHDDVYEISSVGVLGSIKDADARLLITSEYSYALGFWQSIFGTYILLRDVALDCLLVDKEGVFIHDRDVDDDSGDFTFVGFQPIRLFAISPNGKYVAVLCRTTDDKAVILMYEGS